MESKLFHQTREPQFPSKCLYKMTDKMKKENSAEEENNRNLWSRRDQNLRLNVQMYDQEITQNEETVNKMQMDLDDTNVDLN